MLNKLFFTSVVMIASNLAGMQCPPTPLKVKRIPTLEELSYNALKRAIHSMNDPRMAIAIHNLNNKSDQNGRDLARRLNDTFMRKRKLDF